MAQRMDRQEDGKVEAIAAGEVVVGRLMTWSGASLVRFFYSKTDGSERGLPIVDDFESRRAFEVWLAAQLRRAKAPGG